MYVIGWGRPFEEVKGKKMQAGTSFEPTHPVVCTTEETRGWENLLTKGLLY